MSARVNQLLGYIQKRFDRPLHLHEMAAEFGASPAHFHKVFRATTGETPRRLVERLRVERAVLRIASTSDGIANVGRSLGFERHETFSRAFRRLMGKSPTEFRTYIRDKADVQLRNADSDTSTGCKLSAVRFGRLPATWLLAKRRVGDYARHSYEPFARTDTIWNPLLTWATQHCVAHSKEAWGIFLDTPGLTPEKAQRFDGCIRIANEIPSSRTLKCFRFGGGRYAMIDHSGPSTSIGAAYAQLIRAVDRKTHHYAYRYEPSIQIFHDARGEGKFSRGRTTVCIAIMKRKDNKKRQSR